MLGRRLAWHEAAEIDDAPHAGAQAAGFPRALVAGVTTYAYLTHPLLAGCLRTTIGTPLENDALLQALQALQGAKEGSR